LVTYKSKVWSHSTTNPKSRRRNGYVCASVPKRVASYSDLIREVAVISYRNPGMFLFYRGQHREHYVAPGHVHVTAIPPSIYRNPFGARPATTVERRFANLEYAAAIVVNVLRSLGVRPIDKLVKYPELAWSVVQYYGICQTPLIDITHSLSVAASFALDGSTSGIVYVFGLPILTNAISYSIEEELLNIRLLSCCPPHARRPYYQEGYLLSTFPSRAKRPGPELDCAKRLIAKYQIVDGPGFWGRNFRKVSHAALYPDHEDVFRDALKGKFPAFPFVDEIPAGTRTWTT
jgi:hypothetical protein